MQCHLLIKIIFLKEQLLLLARQSTPDKVFEAFIGSDDELAIDNNE